MNPIDLGTAISEHGIPIITAVMLILVVGLVWFLIKRQVKREEKFDIERVKREERHDKQQDDDRKFNRDIITNELQSLHKDNAKNAELNAKSIDLQREMMKDFKEHNGHSEEFSKKMIESFDILCDKINGKVV